MKTDAVPLAIGAAFGGGFVGGYIRVGDGLDAVIVSPKAIGERASVKWHRSLKSIPGAQSFFDGRANTNAMALAGSELAEWALKLEIGGFTDWYLAARDELELPYRHFKPGSVQNYVSFRDGDNPSSMPAGYPYTPTFPEQTAIEIFRTGGGAEAFEEDWYVSSTEYAPDPDYAWGQFFANGGQHYYRKGVSCRARAVRRVVLK